MMYRNEIEGSVFPIDVATSSETCLSSFGESDSAGDVTWIITTLPIHWDNRSAIFRKREAVE